MKRKVVLVLICLFSTYATDAAAQTKRRRFPRSSVASVTTPSGLTYLITKKGTGRLPKAGEVVVLHYTGTLTNGVKFDSSHDRGDPLVFKLGAGRVIKGYDEGVAKLRVGDQAILVIPAKLGYGSKGIAGVIPPESTLIFIVEIVDIKANALSDVLFKTLTNQGIEAMVADYHRLKVAVDSNLYISESDMNGLGYRLMRGKHLDEAIVVFKLNVEAYPQSANVYDSLGEAFAVSGDKGKAIENYQKALAIDPSSESAKQALKKLTGQ